jgi:FkbM family methyltransferase
MERVKRYRKTYRNWISVMWAVYRKKQLIKLKLRNGLELEGVPPVATSIPYIVNFGGDIRRASHGLVEFAINGKSIIFYGWLQGDVLAISDYDWLDVKGRRVLDVGANVGGAAVYFALRGAREVVAFEPYPFPYGFALRNVEANNLKNVRVINAGISGRDGTVRVTGGETTSSDDLKPSDEPDAVEVPIYSLDRVLEEYGPFDVMKMDCEGCEYDAVLNSRKIGELRQIQVEYHYGPERLVEALRKAGFEVEATRPKRLYNSHARDPNMLLGYIYARKRELGYEH